MALDKIAYVSLRFTWSPGVYNKLLSQAKSVKGVNIPIDFYWISNDKNLANRNHESENINLIYVNSNNRISARIQQINFLKNLLNKYPVVVVRYTLFDPIVYMMLKNKENIIWEHHTKELSELKETFNLKYFLEKYFRKLLLNKAIGYTGISQEIVDELKVYYDEDIKGKLITNSFNFDQIQLMEKVPVIENKKHINIVFVASNFKPWHGLEDVLEEFLKFKQDNMYLHIVGNVQQSYLKSIDYDKKVIFHGRLNSEELQKLYANSSLGIGSFGLYKIDMYEGSPLKVREYLASGLPVYAGCKDSGLDEDFPFLIYSKDFSMEKMITFLNNLNDIMKDEIQSLSRKYLDSRIISQKLYDYAINCSRISK